MTPPLIVRNVSRSFGRTRALRGVSLEAGSGILGLLGPNGAGKSTLMHILATYLRPTEGTVLWRGTDIAEDPDALRSELGYLPQDFGVYDNLTPVEFIEYIGALRKTGSGGSTGHVTDVLELVGLSDVRNRPLGTFSGGMRQRVGIAQALVSDPDLLIVDEPTVGLDPGERVRFRNLLGELASRRVIVLSTHLVADIEAAASTVAILRRGELLARATPEELVERVVGAVWEWTVPRSELSATKRDHRISQVRQRDDGVEVRAVSRRRPVERATSVRPTLEDAYLSLLDGEGR